MSGMGVEILLAAARPKPAPLEPLFDSWWEKLEGFVERQIELAERASNLSGESHLMGSCDAVIRSPWRFDLETEITIAGSHATVTRTFPSPAGMTDLSMYAWYYWTALALGVHRGELAQALEKKGWLLRKPIPTVRAVMAEYEACGVELVIVSGELVGRSAASKRLFNDDKHWPCPKREQGEQIRRDPLTDLMRSLWPTSKEDWTKHLTEDKAEEWFQLAWGLHSRDPRAIKAMCALDERIRPYLWFLVRSGSREAQTELCSIIQRRDGERAAWEAGWVMNANNLSRKATSWTCPEYATSSTARLLCHNTTHQEEYMAALGEALERDDEVGRSAPYALYPHQEERAELPALSPQIKQALLGFPPRRAAVLKACLLQLKCLRHPETKIGSMETVAEKTIRFLLQAPADATEGMLRVLEKEKGFAAVIEGARKKTPEAAPKQRKKTAKKAPAKGTKRSRATRTK